MRSSAVINPLVRRESLEEREYQISIYREAIGRNTLVVLPTALGKTVIAALVASHYLYYHSDRAVLVLAPTRPLLAQHRRTFLRLLKVLPDDTKVLTGNDPPEYRLHLWRKTYRVYFATPQVVSNDLDYGLDLSKFSLMIFDECHRAVGRYSYVRIAEEYVKSSVYPVILALTASPGADLDRVKEVCRNLYIERIEARTEDDPDVKQYISPVDISWTYIRLPRGYIRALEMIRGMLIDRLKALCRSGLLNKDPEHVFRGDLVRLGDELRYRLELTTLDEERGALYKMIALQASSLSLFHALELLGSQGRYAVLRFLERLEGESSMSHRMIVNDPKYQKLRGLLDGLSEHPKMDVVIQTVSRALLEKRDSKIIVFTQYRDTASNITATLKRLGFKAVRFVGQARREADRGLSQKLQVEIIDRFRRGDFNILVATSIAEEGLDIPAVDLVIFYEPVPSEIRFIQRRGRTGRGRFGRVVILATEGTVDTAYLRVGFRKTGKMVDVIKRMGRSLEVKFERGPVPPIKIMPEEVIRGAESYVPIEVGISEEAEAIDLIDMKMFNREVRLTAKSLLHHILRRGSVSTDELYSQYQDEIPPTIVNSALKLLESEGQVDIYGNMVYPRGGLRRGFGYGEVHLVEIERILRDRAIVIVDDRWRAILYPEDYRGPKQLLKRGMRFKASSKLYRSEGKLHIRIQSILRIEEY